MDRPRGKQQLWVRATIIERGEGTGPGTKSPRNLARMIVVQGHDRRRGADVNMTRGKR